MLRKQVLLSGEDSLVLQARYESRWNQHKKYARMFHNSKKAITLKRQVTKSENKKILWNEEGAVHGQSFLGYVQILINKILTSLMSPAR